MSLAYITSLLMPFIFLNSCNGQDYQNLFIVGGNSAASASKVETINLQTEAICSNLPYFPTMAGSVGTYMDDYGVIVCGGLLQESGQLASNQCFNYDPNNKLWLETNSTIEQRCSAKAVRLSPTRWWITGGFNSNGTLSSTEVYTVGRGFAPYVDLPVASSDHSLVYINSKYTILLEGRSNKTWALNTETEQWIALPERPLETTRSQAGIITHPNRTIELVMAAGSSAGSHATQILSLDGKWRIGPDFPIDGLHSASSIPYGDTFLIVGGQYPVLGGSFQYSKDIWMYNVADNDWVLMEQKLPLERSMSAAFLVPDDFVVCGAVSWMIDVKVLCMSVLAYVYSLK